jgi:hypothetical protein
MSSLTKGLKDKLASLPHGFTVIDVPYGSVTLRNEWTPEVSDDWLLELYVQLIDAYGYQRELRVERVPHRDPEQTFWRSHAYQHPGRHQISVMSQDTAIGFIHKFFNQVERYPSLLFNDDQIEDGKLQRARGDGFVHLNELLLRGLPLSTRML